MTAPVLAAAINGHRVTTVSVRVPYSGAWRVDADFDSKLEPSQLTGAATLTIGDMTLVGTFVPGRTGSFQLQSKCRIVGGAGLMAAALPPKHYHSDAGVKVSTIVADALREAGETAGTTSITSTDKVRGVDFVRRSASAGSVIDQVLPAGTMWWAGYDGKINVGPRIATEVTLAHEVLEYDPRYRVATVSVDNPLAIQVGSVIRNRVINPLQVGELSIDVGNGKVRLTCWGKEVVA